MKTQQCDERGSEERSSETLTRRDYISCAA
jgi:hypothetical protein